MRTRDSRADEIIYEYDIGRLLQDRQDELVIAPDEVRAPAPRGWSSGLIESLRRAEIAHVSHMIRGRRGIRVAASWDEW
jgi:hypothetical protein